MSRHSCRSLSIAWGQKIQYHSSVKKRSDAFKCYLQRAWLPNQDWLKALLQPTSGPSQGRLTEAIYEMLPNKSEGEGNKYQLEISSQSCPSWLFWSQIGCNRTPRQLPRNLDVGWGECNWEGAGRPSGGWNRICVFSHVHGIAVQNLWHCSSILAPNLRTDLRLDWSTCLCTQVCRCPEAPPSPLHQSPVCRTGRRSSRMLSGLVNGKVDFSWIRTATVGEGPPRHRDETVEEESMKVRSLWGSKQIRYKPVVGLKYRRLLLLFSVKSSAISVKSSAISVKSAAISSSFFLVLEALADFWATTCKAASRHTLPRCSGEMAVWCVTLANNRDIYKARDRQTYIYIYEQLASLLKHSSCTTEATNLRKKQKADGVT